MTDDAIADLDAARRWLTQPGSGPTAWRRLAAIEHAIGRLADNPCLFPVGQHRGIRELPCAGGYRALYVVDPDTGWDETAGDALVLRLFGPGQSRNRLR